MINNGIDDSNVIFVHYRIWWAKVFLFLYQIHNLHDITKGSTLNEPPYWILKIKHIIQNNITKQKIGTLLTPRYFNEILFTFEVWITLVKKKPLRVNILPWKWTYNAISLLWCTFLRPWSVNCYGGPFATSNIRAISNKDLWSLLPL